MTQRAIALSNLKGENNMSNGTEPWEFGNTGGAGEPSGVRSKEAKKWIMNP